MRNQSILTITILWCAGLFCLALARLAAAPNILLITADDMGGDSIGVYGCPVEATTPNLDRLAGQGFRFQYAYVPIAICTPSRQVMLSGNFSHQTMTRGFTELERVGPALPDMLKEQGYYLANINKQQDYYAWDTSISEKESAVGRDVPFFKKAITRIIGSAGKKDAPWFIMANINDPHRPFYNAEAELKDPLVSKFRKEGRLSMPSRVYQPEEMVVPGFLPDLPEIRGEMAQYYSSVRRCDDSVGAILAALEESGQASNTIVVFLSDNGISVPYAKVNCYPASLRVPLIIRWPGRITPDKCDSLNMVSSVDLTPTLLDLLGRKPPAYMAGRSFLPLLEGKPQSDRNHVIGYYYRNLRATQMYPEFTVQTRDFAYIYNPWVDGKKEVHNSDYTGSPSLLAMWKAAESDPAIKARVEFHKHRIIEELYDLKKDPYSFNNLAKSPEYEPVIATMRKLVLDWMRETKHPAAKLMADPLNPELIAEYMAWEKANAQKQIEEVMRLMKERRSPKQR